VLATALEAAAHVVPDGARPAQLAQELRKWIEEERPEVYAVSGFAVVMAVVLLVLAIAIL